MLYLSQQRRRKDLFALYFFFFKQKTAYEWRIRDWSSDVCSSDLAEVSPDVVVLVGDDQHEWFHSQVQPSFAIFNGKEVVNRKFDAEQIGRASCRKRVCQYV